MAAKADRFPPVLVVSGGQHLLRQRFLREVIETQRGEGWAILMVDGSDRVAVRDAMQGGDLFGGQRTLAVVSNPSKVDLDLLKGHQESAEYDVTLLLHIEGLPDGRTKFGKFVKKDLAGVHKFFPKPSSEWKAREAAVEFVSSEAASYGKTMRTPLIHALVDRVGVDLGVLAFEVSKMAMLADSRSTDAIDLPEVKGGMAAIAEASVFPILSALGSRDRKKLSRALGRTRKTSKADPTMRICRFLGSSVIKWMQASYLDALPPKEAASELGINPWHFENNILPPAKRWGKAGTVRLIGDLAAAERAVLNGARNPWLVLVSRLLSAC